MSMSTKVALSDARSASPGEERAEGSVSMILRVAMPTAHGEHLLGEVGGAAGTG